MIRKIKNKIFSSGRIGALFTFAVVGPGLGVFVLVSTSQLWFEPLKTISTQNALPFFIVAIFLAGLSLIPTHAVSLVAGMIFGATLGPTYAILAIVAASLLSYCLTAFLVKDRAITYLNKNPKNQAIYQGLLKHHGFQTFCIIALVRLSPIMPFAATNVLLASAKVTMKEFILASLIGLAPRVIIVAIAGVGLTKFDLSKTHHQGLLICGAIATIVVIALLGYISKKTLKKIVHSTSL